MRFKWSLLELVASKLPGPALMFAMSLGVGALLGGGILLVKACLAPPEAPPAAVAEDAEPPADDELPTFAPRTRNQRRVAIGVLSLLVGAALIVVGKLSPVGIEDLVEAFREDPNVKRQRERADADLDRFRWSVYTSRACGFEVLLPGQPETTTTRRSGWIQNAFEISGGKLTEWQIAPDGSIEFRKLPRYPRLDVFDGCYEFSVALPNDVSFAIARENFAEPHGNPVTELERFRNEIRTVTGGHVHTDSVISLDGAPGRELVSEFGPAPDRLTQVRRTYIHDNALFQVIVVAPQDFIGGEALKRFFSSFRFIPRDEPFPKIPPEPAETDDTVKPGRIVSDPRQGIYREAAPGDVQDWHEFSSVADGFTARFPFEPQSTANQGEQSASYRMSCSGDRLVFAVDVAREWPQGDAVKQFQWNIDRHVASGHVVVHDIQHGDEPRIVADYTITAMGRKFRCHERLYLRPDVAYRVTAMVEGDAEQNHEVEKFFAAFHILPVTKP